MVVVVGTLIVLLKLTAHTDHYSEVTSQPNSHRRLTGLDLCYQDISRLGEITGRKWEEEEIEYYFFFLPATRPENKTPVGSFNKNNKYQTEIIFKLKTSSAMCKGIIK